MGRVIITNKHVIENMIGLQFSFAESADGEPVPGKLIPILVPALENTWIGHPDTSVDLAAIPINQIKMHPIGKPTQQIKSLQPFVSSVDKRLIPKCDQIGSLKLIEETVMVGYPIGLWDSQNNFPLVRRGITATHPGVDFEGKQEFLIDCAVYPGSSGSPVFRYTPELPIKAGQNISIQGGGAHVELLGVLFAGYEQTVDGEIVVANIPTSVTAVTRTNIPINIGIVIRAEKILEMETLFD